MREQSLFFFPLRTNVEFFSAAEDYLALEKRVKQVMLLYDRIIIEDGTYVCCTGPRGSWDLHIPPGDLSPEQRLSTEYSPVSGEFSVVVDGHEVLSSPTERRFRSDFYPILRGIPFESVDWCSRETLGLTSKARRVLQAENLRDQHDREFSLSGASRFLRNKIIDNLNHDLLVSASLGASISISPIYAPLVRRKIVRERNIRPRFNFSVVDVVLPDFTSMDWEQIFKVRDDKALEALRAKLWELNQKVYKAEFDSQADLRAYVSSLLTHELIQEVNRLTPSLKKVILDSLLGAIPGIGLIPVGQLITTSRSVWQLKEYRQSWLALFMKLREKAM